MKKSVLPLIFGALSSFSLMAGEAETTGKSTVYHDAEFVTVALHVKSECYKKPSQAKDANNAAAAKIVEILKAYNTTSAENKIYTNGGFTTSFSKSVMRNNQHETICQDTYQQTTTITFKTKDIPGFSNLFADMQEKVLGTYTVSSADEGESTTAEQATTFVNIGIPHADVCDTVKNEMVNKAADEAAANAQELFWTYAKRCGIKGPVEISRINPPAENQNYGYRTAKASMLSVEMVGSIRPVVETNFEPISVEGQVTLKFKYPQTFIDFSQCKQ